jgi:energy-coupling factor transporter transmembrane protein EcfT
MAIDMLFTGDGASKLIAAMRKMRVSEKAILILSVIFRFFPVIRNDMKIAMQALRTRSFSRSLLTK